MASSLASSLAPQVKAPVHPGALEDWANVAEGAALVVNSTSAGMGSNPFERVKLSLVANVVAFCGGSQFAGISPCWAGIVTASRDEE